MKKIAALTTALVISRYVIITNERYNNDYLAVYLALS